MAALDIDPRLAQFGHQQQQYAASVDALRRAAHQPPTQQTTHSHHAPQPYYLPAVNHSQQQQQQQQQLDPALDDDEDSGHESSGHASGLDVASGQTPGSAQKAADAKRPRACDSCRGLKVKCIIDPASTEPCKRCAKAGRACIVTPPTRKRQKKADGRVAELERKIDALTATLAQREGGASYETGYQTDMNRHPTDSVSPYAHSSPQYQADQRLLPNHERASPTMPRQSLPRPSDGPDKRRRLERMELKPRSEEKMTLARATPNDRQTSIYDQKLPVVFDHSDLDEKIQNIIDHDTAERLFNRYVTHVAPRFPAVPFRLGTSAKKIRKEKPVLFLAILSSTSFGTGVATETQEALERELRDVFATSMWKQGEKSLELIQALHVSTLWYRPPANFEQHMFYQMVHMSAIMAIDIGIGKKQAPWKKRWLGNEAPLRGLPNPECADSRRAWIVCYFLCISITMVLRRPILVRHNDYMKECLEYLETADDALPSDKILCQHVRLAHISEEVAVQFAMDDPTINLSISDGKVKYGIKHFEQDLANVRSKDVSDPALELAHAVTNLYLHEIALHSQTNVGDFKAPFTEETFKTAAGESVLGPQHVDALTACQQSCQDILDTFLAYEFDVIYALPVIFSVRVIYAVVVVIKLYIAATSPGEMSAIIKIDELRVEEHLLQLQRLFKSILDRDSLSPHSKFLWVIQRLIERYNGIKAKRTGNSTPPVPRDLKSNAPANAPAQGLQLLSEVAMSNNQQLNGDANNSRVLNAPGQNPGWYHPAGNPADHMSNLPMETAAYAYPVGAVADYDFFDYGTGSLGMGMDGAISGLFMADGIWNFNEANNQGQLFPGWT